MSAEHRVAGLFAGIGGIELGFARSGKDKFETALFCEFWEPAQSVLQSRFEGVDLASDVRALRDLPADISIVTAGFPCTDLSQAGRMKGIHGEHSGLVSHVFRLVRGLESTRKTLPTLVIENVSNMLALDGGLAMRYLVDELEALGYMWAYRIVDSRFTGVPQRRRRVILVASVELDPRRVLFADDAGERSSDEFFEDAFGFYWTEGRGGLGWAVDAVPTLKGGSTIGIPSPPAVWFPKARLERRFLKPSIEDAEEMQGFPRGWTTSAEIPGRKNNSRWKLVGNAVTVGVAEWLGKRLTEDADPLSAGSLWESGGRWPSAAWGYAGKVFRVNEVSEFPEQLPYRHLSDLVAPDDAEALSLRGAAGFWSRLQQGNLGRFPGFRDDIEQYVKELTHSAA